MYRRGIVLLLLAIVATSSGQCALIEVPASQDVHISLGTGGERVYNENETLLCAVNVIEINNITNRTYSGVPIIQFNISEVEIKDDDVAILVLKAASVRQIERSNMVALLTIGSDWDEKSDITTFLVNILPARNLIEKNDLTAISTNSDGDDIYAFDVSQKLIQARSSGDRISFLLESIGNSTAEIDFYSRESGQGPYLIIMPYPGLLPSSQTDPAVQMDIGQAGQIAQAAQTTEATQADQTAQENRTGLTNETVQADNILLSGSIPAESLPAQTFGFTPE